MIDKKVLEEYHLNPISYKKINNSIIITDNEKSLVFKKKATDKKLVFDYLKSRNFSYIPEYIEDENYDISYYLKPLEVPIYDKGIYLINMLSLLHLKTTSYKNICLDDIKKIYEKLKNRITYLEEYYADLNEILNDEKYMSPASYLLARNITKIYSLLTYCKEELNSFYDEVKSLDKIRIVLLHNNIDLDHIIISDKNYLISWDKAYNDIPIYDIYNFYKKYYKALDFKEILNIYEQKYPLLSYERKLLFVMISIPEKITFDNNSYNNFLKVDNFLKYVTTTDCIISPYYSENKKE